MKKLNFGAILAAIITISGIAASPLVAGLIGAKAAAALIASGSVAQALTDAIHKLKGDAPAPAAPQS